jgi:hypothetical protein
MNKGDIDSKLHQTFKELDISGPPEFQIRSTNSVYWNFTTTGNLT